MADLSQVPADQLLQMLAQQSPPAPSQVSAPIAETPVPQTWREKLMAGPVGQAMGGAMQGVYGLDQLAYKGGAGLASAGGLFPNSVSQGLDQTANDIGNQAKLSSQTYEDARNNAGVTGTNVGKFAGEVASPANFLAGEVSIPAKALPLLGKAGSLANTLLKGAAFGSTAPVDPNDSFGQTKAEQAGIGAGLGMAGKAVGAAANPMGSIAPKVATLLKAGVPLTAGQILGGVPRTLEDASTSIPIVGDFVKSRQRDALAGLNTAVINRSLVPIGTTLPSGLSGHEAVKFAQDKLGTAYDSILSQMSAHADPQLQQDMGDLVTNATRDYGLTADKQKQLYGILQGQLGKHDNGYFSGDTLKDIQSNLSYQSRNYMKSPDPDQKNLGDALADSKQVFNDFIARQNPAQAPTLNAINTGYANFARAQGAAASSKTGIFSPSELARAVRAGGTKSTNSTGQSLMQDLSSAGQEVLPPTVPDSGTAGRHMVGLLAGLLAGGGEHAATGDAGLGVLSMGAGLSAGASKPAQAAIRSLLTKRPYDQNTAAALADLLRTGTPALSGALIPALSQNTN